MRDDAARALRVEDDLPWWADLPDIGDRPPVRHFERSGRSARTSVGARDAVDRDGRRFGRGAGTALDMADDVAEMSATAADILALPERGPSEPLRRERERRDEDARTRRTPPAARTAPGRSYGSHRRGDTAPAAAGYQPGRRTVEIRGQVQQPRRRSQTTSAFIASPDRAALWAFLLALFMIVMAVVTAHG